MFSECSVYLNDKLVSNQVNYGFRAIVESLLFSSKATQETMLTAAGFYKDTATKHDDFSTANTGFTKRKTLAAKSKVMDLMGPLHFDLGSQEKLIPNGVSVRIKLERMKDSFVLMAATDDFKLELLSASLYVRKVDVAASVILAQEKALSKGVMKIPIRRVEVKTFALSKSLQSHTLPNAFLSELPSRRMNPTERFGVFTTHKTLYDSLLDCIEKAKVFEADSCDFPDSPNFQLKIGFTDSATAFIGSMACSSSDRSKMESDDVVRVSKYGKKRAVAVLSEDEDEIAPLNLKKSAPPKKKPALLPKFDVDLEGTSHQRDIEPFCVNVGKGAIIEIKQFRRVYYLGFAKIGPDNEIRNRFNFELSQLGNLKKALEAVTDHLNN
ncbi:hypothetical protein JTE90_004043 [Oedothorax gibbosus]|uniref:Uncharacterized protein n=1 Tax=Oedothorax gibbosus TaxID=931172 RepID=A0AAV6U5I2_9ARAC|nr:hypothetical protein JTE90_004043 [Oedothorax gibbosus]